MQDIDLSKQRKLQEWRRVLCERLCRESKVSLDYLTGNSDIELDKATLERVQEITKLSDKDKDYIYVTLDALIRDFKNKKAYAS